MSATKGKNDPNRIARDRYETPQWCCNALGERISAYFNVPKIGQLIDIGAGDGRIGRTVKEYWTKRETETIDSPIFIEIDDPKTKPKRGETWLNEDYLDTDLDKLIISAYPTLFVSNPPFSLSDEIIEKTVRSLYTHCQDKSTAIFLHRLNWLGSGQRANFINLFPPTHLTILAPRVSFCKKKRIDKAGKERWSSSDACEYAWIWWEKDKDIHDDTPFIEVALDPARAHKFQNKS